jgi:hypothetical protein
MWNAAWALLDLGARAELTAAGPAGAGDTALTLALRGNAPLALVARIAVAAPGLALRGDGAAIGGRGYDGGRASPLAVAVTRELQAHRSLTVVAQDAETLRERIPRGFVADAMQRALGRAATGGTRSGAAAIDFHSVALPPLAISEPEGEAEPASDALDASDAPVTPGPAPGPLVRLWWNQASILAPGELPAALALSQVRPARQAVVNDVFFSVLTPIAAAAEADDGSDVGPWAMKPQRGGRKPPSIRMRSHPHQHQHQNPQVHYHQQQQQQQNQQNQLQRRPVQRPSRERQLGLLSMPVIATEAAAVGDSQSVLVTALLQSPTPPAVQLLADGLAQRASDARAAAAVATAAGDPAAAADADAVAAAVAAIANRRSVIGAYETPLQLAAVNCTGAIPALLAAGADPLDSCAGLINVRASSSTSSIVGTGSTGDGGRGAIESSHSDMTALLLLVDGPGWKGRTTVAARDALIMAEAAAARAQQRPASSRRVSTVLAVTNGDIDSTRRLVSVLVRLARATQEAADTTNDTGTGVGVSASVGGTHSPRDVALRDAARALLAPALPHGQTLLHLAALMGSPAMTELLLSYKIGVDVCAPPTNGAPLPAWAVRLEPDARGLTPLDVASLVGANAVVETLESFLRGEGAGKQQKQQATHFAEARWGKKARRGGWEDYVAAGACADAEAADAYADAEAYAEAAAYAKADADADDADAGAEAEAEAETEADYDPDAAADASVDAEPGGNAGTDASARSAPEMEVRFKDWRAIVGGASPLMAAGTSNHGGNPASRRDERA